MKTNTVLIVMFIILFSLGLTGCKMRDYNKAADLQEDGNYEAALELYEGIEDYQNYKDTPEQVDFCKRMIAAIDKYAVAKAELEEKNTNLDALIAESEELIAKKETPLDDTLIPALETAISEAKAAKTNIPEMPTTEEQILAATEGLIAIDYTGATEKLSGSKAALAKSIKQYSLVYQPTEAYIIECLGKVEHIANISAVTEDNDPNGNLNKLGGYTATVYYSDDRLNLDKSIYGATVIEQGTDGGGAIEVYSTVEDAEKRREYLASYDGTIFATGTHTVIGTVLIRTSDKLTASQQKEMEAKIIEVLIYAEE